MKPGIGTALFEAAKQDARDLGANGMAALLWKPFSDDAVAPEWNKQKKTPEPNQEQVTIHSYMSGWCPAQNLAYERAKRAVGEIGGGVVFKEYHTAEPKVFDEWSILDALYIDGKQVRTGPPPSYEKITKAIRKAVKRKHL